MADNPQSSTAAPSIAATDPAWLAYCFLIMVTLFWAGSAVAGRLAADTIPPVAVTFWRWLLAFAVCLPFGARRLWLRRETAFRHWKVLVLLAFLGMPGFSIPFIAGLQFTQAANAALLNAMSPVLVLIIAVPVLGSRVNAIQLIGIGLATIGTAAIISRGDHRVFLELSFNIGDLSVLVALILWAIYTVALRWAPRDLGPIPFLLAISGLSIPMTLPIYLWEVSSGRTFVPSFDSIAIIVYLGLFSSFLAYLGWNRSVVTLGPERASVVQYLIPVFGALLSVLILNEALAWYHFLGIALIFVGVYSASRKSPKPKPAAEAD